MIKRILSNSSIRNKTLPERKGLSPLLKTYCHRYHYNNEKTFKKWLDMLTFKEKETIYKHYGRKVDNEVEKIICSAIWYKELPLVKNNIPKSHIYPTNVSKGLVFCGHRHSQCMYTMIAITGKRSVTPEVGEYVQGFLTNKNRFVNREEGAKIALECGQITRLNYSQKELYSEDLY